MKKFFPIIASAFLFLPSIYAQSTQFPINPPQNEIKGWYFQNYFRNISGLCSSGQAIYGFVYNENNFLDTNNMKKLCYFPRASSFTGWLSWEDYRIPMWQNNGTELGATIMKQKNESKNAAWATIFIGNTNNHNPDAQISVGTDTQNKPGWILITSGSGANAFIDFAEKDTTTTDSKRPNTDLKASIFWDGKDEQFYINAFQNAKNTIINPNTGNVGIGTKNPTSKLHVEHGISSSVLQVVSPVNKNSSLALYHKNGHDARGWAILHGREDESSSGSLYINYDNTRFQWQKNVMSFLRGGNVGIGLYNPKENLHVDGNIALGQLSSDGDFATGQEFWNRLFFWGAKTNSDPLYMYRYNQWHDLSQLRMVIGDNQWDWSDSFQIGTQSTDGHVRSGKSFSSLFAFNNSWRLGVRKDPAHELDVNGRIASIPSSAHGEIILGTPWDYAGSNGIAIGNTQHKIFGPYNTSLGTKWALYIGAGRNGSNWEKNEIILYNLDCSGPDRNDPTKNTDCNTKAIRLYADETTMAKDVVIGNDLFIANNLRVGFWSGNDDGWRWSALEANGGITARTGYGQQIYIGGDAYGNDAEISIRGGTTNKLSFWNYWLGQTIDLHARAITSDDSIIAKNSVTAQSFLYRSDKRLKDSIVSLKKMTDLVRKLNPVSFTWKDSSKKSIGFIAQEVEKIFPELVYTDENGYKSVEYANIIAVLVAAFQEQDEKILELEKEIVTQNEKIKELEEKINKILQKK